MSWQSIWNWITGGSNSPAPTTSPTPSHRQLADASDARAKAENIDPPREGRKTYQERYAETTRLTDTEIRTMIAEREAAGKPTGVLHRVLADREASQRTSSPTRPMTHREKADASDARAKAHNIDPPREGRKTYQQRYTESSGGSSSSIRAQIAERQSQGKETGVLERILADRGE